MIFSMEEYIVNFLARISNSSPANGNICEMTFIGDDTMILSISFFVHIN